MSDLTFEERLAAVTVLFAQVQPGSVHVPVALKDQIDAAAQEATDGINRVRAAIRRGELPRFDPDGCQRSSITPEIRARIYLAMKLCEPCEHLNSPRMLFVRLAQYRIDCQECLALDPRPEAPLEDADRCDWCGRRGVVFFWPQYVQQGAAILVGNACDDCNEGMRHG